MKRENQVLLFLICAGMELCYLYACTTFVTTLVLHQTFPFPEAVGSFLLATLLTALSLGRGWRVIYVLAFESLGFVPALFRMVDVFNSWSGTFLKQTWLTNFFGDPASSIQYFIFVLVLVWTFVFWVGGVELVRRERDYATLCSRFDRGLVAFFILFLTKFYLQAVQGIAVDESGFGSFLFPFLIFSLLAIGLVRNQSRAQRSFLPGYQTVGVMLSFIAVILLAGAGLVFFFLPYLTMLAEKGNDMLKLASGPFVTVLLGILTWIFGNDFATQPLPVEKTPIPQSTAQLSFPGWIELISRILAGGVGIFIALVFLAILGGLVYGIFRWLVSRTAVNENPSPHNLFSSLSIQLRELFHFFWRGLIRNVKGRRGAIWLYTALRAWGRHSGVPLALDETPNEYEQRLVRRFPLLEKEIGLIVEAFNREVYGEMSLSRQQLDVARAAWRKLASPLHYPMRLKAWFFRSFPRSESA